MALVWKDRVKETVSSGGVSAFALAGAPSGGFQTFLGSGFADQDTCDYFAVSPSSKQWESGIGTYNTALNTLSRTTVQSSSGGSIVNFVAGDLSVFLDPNSTWFTQVPLLNVANTFTALQTFKVTGSNNYLTVEPKYADGVSTFACPAVHAFLAGIDEARWGFGYFSLPYGINYNGSGFFFERAVMVNGQLGTSSSFTAPMLEAIDPTNPFVRVWKTGNSYFDFSVAVGGYLRLLDTSGNQLLIFANKDGSGGPSTGDVGLGPMTAPASRWHVIKDDAVTAALTTVETVGHRSSGTPAAGFGLGRKVQLDSSTTQDRDAASSEVSYVVATDASRTVRWVDYVNDAAAKREVIRRETDGVNALLGFLGATAVAQQSVGAAATDAASTQTLANNLRTALINLGLCKT